MSADPDCDFCQIVAGDKPARVVLRTEKVVALFPLEPATIGHTLVIPRPHIPNIWALDDGTAQYLTEATLRIARAVREALNPQGLNIIQSNGTAATQTVMHLHVHVVPRWDHDGMGPFWPERTNWTDEDKDAALTAIRNSLGSPDASLHGPPH
ncbi:HIT family protein [Blastococcus deserti]|uniref:HIT family protein n=1 Tax=Blastococcus deserti TaxID=2259033 RepID=A0ABW4XGQ1_9ACTN